MSRVDELQAKLTAQRRMVDASQSNLDAQRKIEQDMANELAALKAESEKPIEQIAYAGPNGALSFIYSHGWRQLTLVEKKPLVVTREMVTKMQSVYWGASVSPDPLTLWVKTLKVAGIDAEAGDE